MFGALCLPVNKPPNPSLYRRSLSSCSCESVYSRGTWLRAAESGRAHLRVWAEEFHTVHDIEELSRTHSLDEMMSLARSVRERRSSSRGAITFSPKVFIPLTRLCRDSCGYCTFAMPPAPGRRAFMTLDEVAEVARLGAQQGCTEALFTLGDKPELKWPEVCRCLFA